MFKSVEESLELFINGEKSDTGFEYVFNCEEVCFFDDDDNYEFDVTKNYFDQLNEIRQNSEMQVVEIGQRPYDEFTQTICPAYKA